MRTRTCLIYIFLVIFFTVPSAALSLDSDSLESDLENSVEKLGSEAENAINSTGEKIGETTENVENPVLGETQVNGIIVPTTEVFSDRISQIREKIPRGVPANSYFLLSETGSYLIFSDKSLEVGEYTVKGRRFPEAEIRGDNYATIISEGISTSPPEKIRLRSFRRNMEDYRYREVKLSGTIREASFSTGYSSATTPVSFGVISNRDPVKMNIAGNLRGRTQRLAENPEWATFTEVLELDEARVPIIDPNQRYWTNSRGEVTGVVLSPEELLKTEKFMNEESRRIINGIENSGAVYVKKIEFSPERKSISEVQNSVKAGDNIQISGSGLIESLSLQETLGASGTAAIPADVVLKAGVLWNPKDPLENILILGATSDTLKKSHQASGGIYKISGKVISAQTLDSSFPSSRKVLVIHKLERKSMIDDIDYPSSLTSKKKIPEDILEGDEIKPAMRRQKDDKNIQGDRNEGKSKPEANKANGESRSGKEPETDNVQKAQDRLPNKDSSTDKEDDFISNLLTKALAAIEF